VKLFSKNSNLSDHDTWTLRTDRQTGGFDGRSDGRACCGNSALCVASRETLWQLVTHAATFNIMLTHVVSRPY